MKTVFNFKSNFTTTMAKQTVNSYIRELKKMIQSRTGIECEPWLIPQVRATAMNMVMLDKIQDEIDSSTLTKTLDGSMGQPKTELNPLLPIYKDLQRTLLQQFEAIGLNYKITPSKVKEDTKRGVDENDPLSQALLQNKAAIDDISDTLEPEEY